MPQGVLYLGVHLVGSGKFPLKNVYGVLLTKPFLERWSYSLVCLFFIRLKYYFAWKVGRTQTKRSRV